MSDAVCVQSNTNNGRPQPSDHRHILHANRASLRVNRDQGRYRRYLVAHCRGLEGTVMVLLNAMRGGRIMGTAVYQSDYVEYITISKSSW